MPSEPLVSARDVLRVIEEVRRVGGDQLLLEWERREPDLAEHLIEGISALHRCLTDLGVTARTERRLRRQSETLILVLLMAQRRALLRHWQDEDVEAEPEAGEASKEDPRGS